MTAESIARRVFIAGEPFRLIARGWPTLAQCDEAAGLASVAFVFQDAKGAADLDRLAAVIATRMQAEPGLLVLEPMQAKSDY